ncbi:MAG TPA: ABC transporter permease [Candidatus Acidoferrales bacterium]|nr:ABC transporter permease [Candidatus Acidoferrales bacterium]
MNPREVARAALRALAVNKMRSLLTMLGVIIGVAAVISTVAIGEGASDQVQAQIRMLGPNIVFAMAGSVNRNGVHTGSGATKSLTIGDEQAVARDIPSLIHVTPEVRTNAQVVYQGQNWYTLVRGGTPEYLKIRQWDVVRGSAFTDRDVTMEADVCLAGKTVVDNLFPGEDPVGKIVRVHDLPFTIIGELKSVGEMSNGFDEDDVLIMPYTTVQKKVLGISWIMEIAATADSIQDIPGAEQQMEALLRMRHKLRPTEDDDFIVHSSTEMEEAQQQAGEVMTTLLASIASVSLLVGGIGIMNIMLVSVAERRREIGIRRAVGATRGDIRWQFLSEALALSLLGGAVGVVGGFFGSAAVSGMLHWPTHVPPEAVGIAVLFSAGVGIFFGYYPAHKAAVLDPIESLRYE